MRFCINKMPVFKYKIHRTIQNVTGPMTVEADTWLEARVRVEKTLQQNNAYKDARVIRIQCVKGCN